MEFKPKNRDWVKNAAIVFLAVLLVLTFFSNTIMNRSLPEVATQNVQNGSITAKVRGTGTVTATGTHTVKATQTREIRAVMIKAGQEVNAGDVLFVLGEGESSEIEQAQETLRSLQLSYQRTAIGVPTVSYKAEEREIENAKEALAEAKAELEAVKKKSTREIPSAQLDAAEAELYETKEALGLAKDNLEVRQTELESKKIDRDTILSLYNDKLRRAIDYRQGCEDLVKDQEALIKDLEQEQKAGKDVTRELIEAREKLDELKEDLEDAKAVELSLMHPEEQEEVSKAEAAVAEAEKAVDDAQEAYNDADTAVAAAKAKIEAIQAVIDEIMGTETVSEEYKKAKQAVKAAEDYLFNLENNLELKKISDSKSQSLSYLDLTDLG